jgi:hypothetical protein
LDKTIISLHFYDTPRFAIPNNAINKTLHCKANMLALFFFGFGLVPLSGAAVVSTVPPSGVSAGGASAGGDSAGGASAGGVSPSSWKSFSASGRFPVVVRSNAMPETELFPAPMDFSENRKKIKLLN